METKISFDNDTFAGRTHAANASRFSSACFSPVVATSQQLSKKHRWRIAAHGFSGSTETKLQSAYHGVVAPGRTDYSWRPCGNWLQLWCVQKTSQAVTLKKNNTLKSCSFVQTFQAHNCTSQSLNPTPFTHRRTHTHAENGGTWCIVFLRTALIAWERRGVWVMCHVTFFFVLFNDGFKVLWRQGRFWKYVICESEKPQQTEWTIRTFLEVSLGVAGAAYLQPQGLLPGARRTSKNCSFHLISTFHNCHLGSYIYRYIDCHGCNSYGKR